MSNYGFSEPRTWNSILIEIKPLGYITSFKTSVKKVFLKNKVIFIVQKIEIAFLA